MLVRFRLDQLSRNPQLIAKLLYRCFHNVGDPKHRCDFGNALVGVGELHNRAARDYVEVCSRSEFDEERIVHPVREQGAGVVTADRAHRENSN